MNNYAGYSRLKISLQDGVLTVLLSQPQRRNAMDEAMHRELPRLWREIAQDREVRVVLLTGDLQGGAFCAGGDLRWVSEASQSGEGYEEILRDGVDIIRGMTQLPQPVITVINGAAVGVGASIALFGDIVYADETATIADPHVSIGVVAGDGGAIIWPLLVGPNRAKEFLMTGDPLSGKEAAALGLVNHALPAAELAAAAHSMARRLADGPRLAIELTKRSVNLQMNALVNQILPASLAMEGLTFRTRDHHMAVDRFLSRAKAPKA